MEEKKLEHPEERQDEKQEKKKQYPVTRRDFYGCVIILLIAIFVYYLMVWIKNTRAYADKSTHPQGEYTA